MPNSTNRTKRSAASSSRGSSSDPAKSATFVVFPFRPRRLRLLSPRPCTFVLLVFILHLASGTFGLYLQGRSDLNENEKHENTDYVYLAKSESEMNIRKLSQNGSPRIITENQQLNSDSVKIGQFSSLSKNNKNLDPLWYLNKFGYLDTKKIGVDSKMSAHLIMMPSADSISKNNHNGTHNDMVEEAIKKFQRFAKLNVTGKLNNETLRVMKMPRCGHPDILDDSSFLLSNSSRLNLDRSAFLKILDANKRKSDDQKRRKKRYALQGSKWSKSKLKFRIGKYPMYSMLTREQIDEEIQRALDLWSEVSDVEFEQIKEPASKSLFSKLMLFSQHPFASGSNKKADIDVRFETGFHGDSEPFDGSGLILGHAYFPEFGGSTHFDADEFWTSKSTDGVNLFQVAVHEFGHALGLEHSDNFDAIMAPFFRGYTENFRLHPDDLIAIEMLYGKSKRHAQSENQETQFIQDGQDALNTFLNGNQDADLGQFEKNFNIQNLNQFLSNPTPETRYESDKPLQTQEPSFRFTSTTTMTTTSAPFVMSHQMPLSSAQSMYPFGLQPLSFAQTIPIENFYSPSHKFTLQVPQYLNAAKSNLCLEGTFDAISVLSDGFTYIFKGAYVYKMSSNFVIDSDYPKLTSSVFGRWHGTSWVSLPNNLDTVLFVPDLGITYFFKDNLYWRSSKLYSLDADYPRLISENFNGLNEQNGFNGKLDASFVWSGNRRVYFIEENRYWRYDFRTARIEPGYPKKLSIWRGLPAKITDAFLWLNGVTYFFENERYYRFNDFAFRVQEAFPPYPRLNSENWFGCVNPQRLGKLVWSTPIPSEQDNATLSFLDEQEIEEVQPINSSEFNYTFIMPTTSSINLADDPLASPPETESKQDQLKLNEVKEVDETRKHNQTKTDLKGIEKIRLTANNNKNETNRKTASSLSGNETFSNNRLVNTRSSAMSTNMPISVIMTCLGLLSLRLIIV